MLISIFKYQIICFNIIMVAMSASCLPIVYSVYHVDYFLLVK